MESDLASTKILNAHCSGVVELKVPPAVVDEHYARQHRNSGERALQDGIAEQQGSKHGFRNYRVTSPEAVREQTWFSQPIDIAVIQGEDFDGENGVVLME